MRSGARTARCTPRTWTARRSARRWLNPANRLGLAYQEDVNGITHGSIDTIGWCQQTRKGRRRASAARTYLAQALSRPNLRLITNAMVHRVIFEGKRALGVEFGRGGVTQRATAGREVILSAGAIGSPHILQLSGVGDAENLSEIGVPVVHALNGVGRNMQDHFQARISYPVAGLATANEKARGIPLAIEVLRWMFTGKGMLTYSPSLVAASVKVLESIGLVRHADHLRARQLQGRADRRVGGNPGSSAPALGRCARCRVVM